LLLISVGFSVHGSGCLPRGGDNQNLTEALSGSDAAERSPQCRHNRQLKGR
jgi:hypothetical protein